MKKKAGRKPVLDAEKKGKILGVLAVGCSRRVAAAYVGCSVPTIRNTALREPDFARKLGRAENQAEIGYLRQIQKAAEKAQYWRAAAWVLERRNPRDFALRRPDTITLDHLRVILAQVAQAILEPVTDREIRKQIMARLNTLVARLPQLKRTEALK